MALALEAHPSTERTERAILRLLLDDRAGWRISATALPGVSLRHLHRRRPDRVMQRDARNTNGTLRLEAPAPRCRQLVEAQKATEIIANSTGQSARPVRDEAPSPEHKEWLAISGTRLVRETVAFNLRRARERAGLSQHALAEHSGIARRTILRIENAEGDTVLPKVYALAFTLSIPIGDLLAGLPETKGEDGPAVQPRSGA